MQRECAAQAGRWLPCTGWEERWHRMGRSNSTRQTLQTALRFWTMTPDSGTLTPLLFPLKTAGQGPLPLEDGALCLPRSGSSSYFYHLQLLCWEFQMRIPDVGMKKFPGTYRYQIPAILPTPSYFAAETSDIRKYEEPVRAPTSLNF